MVVGLAFRAGVWKGIEVAKVDTTDPTRTKALGLVHGVKEEGRRQRRSGKPQAVCCSIEGSGKIARLSSVVRAGSRSGLRLRLAIAILAGAEGTPSRPREEKDHKDRRKDLPPREHGACLTGSGSTLRFRRPDLFRRRPFLPVAATSLFG
jgi:hypothetical protein